MILKRKNKRKFKDVIINFNTISIGSDEPEKIKEITSELLEELPQIKESYYSNNKRDDGILSIEEQCIADEKWKDDLTTAASVVMKILRRNPKYCNCIDYVHISSDEITFD